MIEAKVIADSVNPQGDRLTTFVLVYPRFIHSEFMTHRVISRNAASSRAIPVQKMIERVLLEPAMPVSWGKNQRGMQAGEDLRDPEVWAAVATWREACLDAVKHARKLLDLGVHKQIANRLLEPFAHMTTIATATSWGNFFNLRCHRDAQPEFQALAYAMLEAYVASTPQPKKPGEWHLPFGDRYLHGGWGDFSVTKRPFRECLKICAARCARVSYLNFDGDIDPVKDCALHDDLIVKGHMSPFEHAAVVPEVCAITRHWAVQLDDDPRTRTVVAANSGNFRGWLQYRKLLPNEHREAFDPQRLLQQRNAK